MVEACCAELALLKSDVLTPPSASETSTMGRGEGVGEFGSGTRREAVDVPEAVAVADAVAVAEDVAVAET
jgi:hypothetical protein